MVITGVVDSYSVPTNARDVSKAFNLIKREETPLLNSIEMSGVALNTKHEWWDDARQITGTTLGAAYVSGAGSLTLASSKGLRAGSILSIDGIAYRVTGVTSDTAVTVVVASGGADAAHANGSVVSFHGTAAKEGEDFKDSDITTEILRYNVTQILDDYIKLTGTELAVKREINEADLLIQYAQKKLERLYLSLGRSIWKNPRVVPTDNTTPRVLGGVDWFIAQNGYVPSAASFTSDNFDAFLLELEGRGANIGEVWMNPTMMAYFAGLDLSKVQLQRDDQTRGVYVDKYKSKYGHELVVKTDRNAPAGKLYVFRTEQVKILPLAGRQMQVVKLDKTGDSEKRQILGEYTLEVWNSSVMGVFTPNA